MKKTIKQKFKKLSKVKKILLFMFVFALPAITGIWVLNYSPVNSSGVIIDSEGINFADNFAITEWNSNAAATIRNDVEINNLDSNRSAYVTFETIITDNITDSCDNLNDCSVVINYGDDILTSGDEIIITPDYSNLTATTSCVANSCPQTIETSLQING